MKKKFSPFFKYVSRHKGMRKRSKRLYNVGEMGGKSREERVTKLVLKELNRVSEKQKRTEV